MNKDTPYTQSTSNPYIISLKWQIPLGILFGLLNHGVYFLQSFNPVPLYMDTLFTVTASFFGPVSGVLAAVLYHILYLFIYPNVALSSLVWSICSLSIVLIISLEGAIIFTILNSWTDFIEDLQIKFMYALLNSNSFSVFVSALLPRVPVNILDKAICTLLGWFSFLGLQKLFTLSKKA